MLKEILKKLGVEFAEDISDEDAKSLIEQQIDAKDEHITNLESEKETLSKSNEELTASIDGYKSSEEKLNKELSDTKTELSTTKGKLEQVTDMYKEQFNRAPDDEKVKEVKSEVFDVLEMLSKCSD